MDWIRFGRFGRPHGTRGEIRFWPFNPESALLTADREINIGDDSPSQTHRVRHLRIDSKGAIVALEGVDDREAAQALTGRTWYEHREAFPSADDDEFYVVDLIGSTVITEAGDVIGQLNSIETFGPVDTYVVRDGAREYMIPGIDTFIRRIDAEKREVVIRPVEGLLDNAG